MSAYADKSKQVSVAGLGQTSTEKLMDRAVERTHLDDFGSNSFREPLEILHRSNIAAAPPAEALARVEEMYVDALTNRLRLIDYIRRNPALTRQPVPRPLVAFGLPRSGTTLVSYLLDQDQARRSLLTWETKQSVPPPTTATLRTDARCLAMVAAQQAEFAAKPDEIRPHVELADGPTECIQLHGQEFKALMWEAYMPVREYSRWILHADMISAYEYQKAALQVLQSQAPGIWSLKMPSHALHIEALYKVFPDARFVWVHRDPHRALASLFSMKSRRWKQWTGEAGIDWLREHYPTQLGLHANRPLRLRERIGNHRFYDIYYSDMMGDPIAALRGLYQWSGDELTAATERAMRTWLAKNPQGRFGHHSYGLQQFGLSEAALRPYFGDYLDAFNPEREN
jgi:hypothetical protein